MTTLHDCDDTTGDALGWLRGRLAWEDLLAALRAAGSEVRRPAEQPTRAA